MVNFADLYSDYLISSSSYTISTGMASFLCIKHDKITRALSQGIYGNVFLWKQSKYMFEN
jgi:hypothetical protein